jgi:hypothetical protein
VIIVLLCAAGADPYFEDLVKNANRVFYFNKGPRVDVCGIAKANTWVKEEQETCLRSSRKIHEVALAQGHPRFLVPGPAGGADDLALWHQL